MLRKVDWWGLSLGVLASVPVALVVAYVGVLAGIPGIAAGMLTEAAVIAVIVLVMKRRASRRPAAPTEAAPPPTEAV